MARLPADEVILARKGHATTPKRDVAARFARKVIKTRGHVGEADVKAVRDAGYADALAILIAAASRHRAHPRSLSESAHFIRESSLCAAEAL
jgi:hypothetical protein